MRLFHFSLGLALAGAAAPSIAAPDEALAARVDAVAAHYAKMPITGMTIGISKDGQTLFTRGYGLADIAGGRPADGDTVYEIGSITKEFTAAAILKLAEQGKLTLDDPVGARFPALAERAKGVTVRHLLNHTSGLFSGPASDDLTKPVDPGAVVDVLASKDAEFAPGERFRYNNNGFILLGLLIEQASGIDYGDYIAREFARPLGLDKIAICTAERAPEVATAYDHPARGEAVPVPFEKHHPSVSFAAGAICSTAGDLLAWQEALVNGRVISPESFAMMATPAPLSSGRPSRYGLGLYSDEASGERRFHHGGASSGFITQLGYFPSDRTGIVVLTNGIYSGAIVEQVEQALLRAVREEPQDYPTSLKLSEAERDLYSGFYELGPVTMEVYAQGEDLRAQPPGQVSARLLHQGGGRFVAEHDPAMELDFRSENGLVTELLLSRNGQAMPPAKRVAKP